MKYFSLDSVISAFEDNKNKTSDGFWGIMAILRSLDCTISPCIQYDIDCQKVASILESWFSVRSTYKTYNTSAIWYVVFSSKWVEQLSMFVKSNPAPNIYNVIAWMYQHHAFENSPSESELLSLFCKDTSIEYDELSSLFDMSKREFTFSDYQFSHSEKIEKLASIFGAIDNNNSIKSNGNYIVAEAGAFQRAPFTQTLYASTENYKCLMITSAAPNVYYPANFNENRNIVYSPMPRQVIYFGAPGTGKSHAVNKIVKEQAPKNNVRTTFHPDSDYSSFVGCYKPIMRDGKIEYGFTAQAFIKAYIGAWSDVTKPYYLVIEEINRGNCAQIFGDIFQILDRDKSGESSYSIKPDSDLQHYIAERLKLVTNIPEEIALGDEMRLPSNLYIYATMNTSDQSLFPIDSAFKRRWDWRYTAIKPSNTDHSINVKGVRYNWTSFIREVNKKILDLTKSEDKQLGYWFIKPDDDGNIDWELFVSKALFYLWNDVIKDYATLEKADSPFGRNYAFTTFFDENGKPIADRVIAFLDALKVEKLIDTPDNTPEGISEEENEESEEDGATSLGKDRTKYSINGEGRFGKNILATELVRKYIETHPDATAFDVVKAFRGLGNLVSHFVELQEEFDQREDQNPRVKTVSCKNENIYVSTNGWGGKDKMRELIDGVHSKDWGLTISEIPN